MSGLVVLAPPAQGTVFVLNQQRDAVIGREGFCDIVLTKRTISRKHARVFFDGGQYRVEDLGSAHGTFLNGNRVLKSMPLKEGDRINVFDIPIVFSESDTPRVSDTSQFSLGMTQGITMTPLPATRTSAVGFSSRLRSLLDITRRLGSCLVMDEIYPKVLDLLFQMFPQAMAGEIQLVDRQGQLVPVAMKHGRDDDSSIITRLPIDLEMSKQVLASGQPLQKTTESGSADSVLEVDGSNVLCVPIIGPSRARLGAILLETEDDHRVFSDDDIELISTIGIETGQAIEFARAHEASLRMDQTQRQLETARQIQLRMLPRQQPKLRGYIMEKYYSPAESVGGDYYFWDLLPDGRAMIGVADACGKSLPAALMIAQFATELRHCLPNAETLKGAMTSLNQFVCTLDEGFITFCLCLLDTKQHLLTVVNAGHPRPICRRHETGAVEPILTEKSSMPLGICPNESFHPLQVLLRPSDEVILFTDGLTEAMNPQNSLYGTNRLMEQIAAPQSSLAARIHAIVADVESFRAGRRPTDDTCLVGIARTSA